MPNHAAMICLCVCDLFGQVPLVKLDDKYFKLVDQMQYLAPHPPSLLGAKSLTVKVKGGEGAFAGRGGGGGGRLSPTLNHVSASSRLCWVQYLAPHPPSLLGAKSLTVKVRVGESASAGGGKGGKEGVEG